LVWLTLVFQSVFAEEIQRFAALARFVLVFTGVKFFTFVAYAGAVSALDSAFGTPAGYGQLCASFNGSATTPVFNRATR